MTLVLMAAGNSSSRHSTLMANEDESHVRHLGVDSSPLTDSYVSTYEIVATFDHDPNAFTQGLAFSAAGTLYESDGLYHQSSVRSIHCTAAVWPAVAARPITNRARPHIRSARIGLRL